MRLIQKSPRPFSTTDQKDIYLGRTTTVRSCLARRNSISSNKTLHEPFLDIRTKLFPKKRVKHGKTKVVQSWRFLRPNWMKI